VHQHRQSSGNKQQQKQHLALCLIFNLFHMNVIGMILLRLPFAVQAKAKGCCNIHSFIFLLSSMVEKKLALHLL